MCDTAWGTKRLREKYGPGVKTERSEVVRQEKTDSVRNLAQISYKYYKEHIICCLLCTAGLFPLLKMFVLSGVTAATTCVLENPRVVQKTKAGLLGG